MMVVFHLLRENRILYYHRYNGLEFCNAQKKLNALIDARHSDEEIERPIAEIDDDIRKVEDLLLHDLTFRDLLRPCPPSRTSWSYFTLNLHASGTRIGLMDSTVPIEALVSGVIHPC